MVVLYSSVYFFSSVFLFSFFLFFLFLSSYSSANGFLLSTCSYLFFSSNYCFCFFLLLLLLLFCFVCFFASFAVAKIFKPDCLEYYWNELHFLRETASVPELEGRVSKLLVSSPPKGYFFLSPVGVHFASSEVEYVSTRYCTMPQPETASPKGPQFVRAKPSTFAELVSTLKVLHSTVKIVHRDIRANNIFQTATGQVFTFLLCLMYFCFLFAVSLDSSFSSYCILNLTHCRCS